MKATHDGEWRRYLRWCPNCDKKSVKYLKNSRLPKPYKCLKCEKEFTTKMIKDVQT